MSDTHTRFPSLSPDSLGNLSWTSLDCKKITKKDFPPFPQKTVSSLMFVNNHRHPCFWLISSSLSPGPWVEWLFHQLWKLDMTIQTALTNEMYPSMWLPLKPVFFLPYLFPLPSWLKKPIWRCTLGYPTSLSRAPWESYGHTVNQKYRSVRLSHRKMESILNDTMPIMSSLDHKSLGKNCNLSTLQNNPCEAVILLFFFFGHSLFQWGKWGVENTHNLLQDSQLVSGQVGTCTQILLLQIPYFFYCIVMVKSEVKLLVTQSCLTLCNPMDYSLPGFSVHGDSPDKNIGVGSHSFL